MDPCEKRADSETRGWSEVVSNDGEKIAESARRWSRVDDRMVTEKKGTSSRGKFHGCRWNISPSRQRLQAFHSVLGLKSFTGDWGGATAKQRGLCSKHPPPRPKGTRSSGNE